MRPGAIAMLLAASLFSGATTIGGPVAGYVAQSSGNVLRPIIGVPGSYRFGNPIALPEGILHIHVAPGQDYALAESTDGGLAVLRLSGTRLDSAMPFPGVSIAADWVVFSPGAASAVLVSASARRLLVVSGLPAAPHIVREIDTTSLPETPRTAAISDDARVLLIASRQRLYLLSPSGNAELLASAREIAALALCPNGADAAVWDTAGSIHLWQNLTSSPHDRLLLTGFKGIGKLYPSWDGSALFAILQGSRAVHSIDIASGEISEIDAGEAPTVLDPLRNRDTFLISAKPRQPGWIFYQDGTAAHVVFVVPPPEPVP